MKKIALFLLLVLSPILNWAQTTKKFVGYEYTESYIVDSTNQWKDGPVNYGKFDIEITQEQIKIIYEMHYLSETYNILYTTLEDGDKVIYTMFNGLKYKFVFPFKDSKAIIVYTLERTGETFELFYFKLN